MQKYTPAGRYRILAISKKGTLYEISLTYDQLNLLGAVTGWEDVKKPIT